MYEIWLMLNILWELALGAWPLLAAALLAWAVLLGLAWRRSSDAGATRMRAWRGALAVGAVATVVAFLVMPALTRSSLGELAYWVDWLSLAGMACGVGAATFVFSWPLLKLLPRPSPAA